MSGVKRKREKTAQIQKDLDVVFRDGFRRAIIKSDESGRFVGVYYISPNDEYLKNMTDVTNWLDAKISETNLIRSNFNFISKKLTDSLKEEFIIEQHQLPAELLDYMLEKKKSVAPGIVIIDNEINSEKTTKLLKLENNEINCKENNDSIPEPPTKIECSLIETSLNSPKSVDDCVMLESGDNEYEENPEPNPPMIMKKEYSLKELVLIHHKPFQNPIIPIAEQYILEIGKNCHSERLIGCLKMNFQEIENKLQPFCNNSCADLDGIPRVVFECDSCLALWHTDCIGHRWLTVDTIKLLICDNCDLLCKSINVDIPNAFCDIEKLFQIESRIENWKNTSTNQVSPKLLPMLKLCQMQWAASKLSNPDYFSKNKHVKSKLQNELGKSVQYRLTFETMLNHQNFVRELQDEYIRLKYNMKSVDLMARIFADYGCQLRIDDKLIQMHTSKITLRRGEIYIPISGQISRPSRATFFTIERNQDSNDEYKNRCEELKTALMSSFYGRFDNSAIASDYKSSKILKDSKIRAIQIKPIITSTSAPNCFKIISSNRVFVPNSNSANNQTILTSTISKFGNQPTLVKLRQRKQDFTCHKSQSRIYNYMKHKQFNLLNLPFLVLERILSCSSLSTMDKLNCRMTSRVLKCIVDGGQVWQKLVINPGCVSGLDNMWNFFRSKSVKKITFLIDFQESFGIEFLLSFISRLKMFPEHMALEKFTIKFIGSMTIQSIHQVSVQDILSCCKFVKVVSISSETPISLTVNKKKFSSNLLEKLKLKNIQNVCDIIYGNTGNTPNLKTLHCGDWSFVTTFDHVPLTNITNLKMHFGHSVNMKDTASFSQLDSLEKLVISRPVINNELLNLLINVLKPKRLCKVFVQILVTVENPDEACYNLAYCFPKHIPEVILEIKLERMKSIDQLSIKTLSRRMQETLPMNVQLRIV